MSEQNKAIVRRFIDEAFNRRNLDGVGEFLHTDYCYHGSCGREAHGLDGVRQVIGMFLEAFPDLEVTVDDLLAGGDKVVTRWTARGTQKGALMGMAPTGNRGTMSGIVISQLKDGKVIEDWEQMDLLHLFQQLGYAPTPAAP